MRKLFFLFLVLTGSFSIFSQTLRLTTSPQYVRLGDFDIPGNQITIEALIKKTAAGGNILSKHTDPSNVNYLMRVGTFEITTNTGFSLMVNPYAGSMQNNVWYHVAGTYDGAYIRYYVNGCLIVQEPRTGNMIQNNLIAAIGNISTNPNGEQFYGEIDELRIWNVARTAAELEANMFDLPNPTTQAGLLAYYKFDNNLVNSQGNTVLNGTWVGTAQYGTQPTASEIQPFVVHSITPQNPSCFGFSDGQITVSATGQGLQYSINGTTWQTSNVLTGLSAGNYTVYVRNLEGCILSDATIVISNPPQINATASNSGPFCSGNPIQLSGASTSPSPSFAWTGPNGYTSSVQNPTDATEAGIYSLTVTSGGCLSPAATTTVVIHPTPSATAANTGPYCQGNAIQLNGATTTSGTATYAWTGPNGYTSSSQNPTNATEAGSYSLLVTIDGCASQPAATTVVIHPVPGASASNTGPYCQGNAIQLNSSTSSAGTATYAWTGPNGYTSTLQNPANATEAGSYSVIVTINGCNSLPAATTVVINANSVLTLTKTDVLCNGGTTGTASVSTNTTGNHNYSWSPSGGSSASANNLPAGTYTVAVTNPSGCTSTSSITISQPPVLTSTISVTTTSCIGNTGTATVNVSGGVMPYSYSWSSNVSSSAGASGLGAGIYDVLIKDANQCENRLQAVIVRASPPVASIQSTQPSCHGQSDGSISITATGGTPAYSYFWIPSVSSSSSAANLPEGSYKVIVTDNKGCTDTVSTQLIQPSPLQVSFDITHPGCGASNGALFAVVSGGTGPYSYLWTEQNLTSNSLSNLAADTFYLQVTDANGCQVSEVINLLPDNLLDIQTNPSTATVNEGSSVNLNATFTPYIPGSTYEWSPPEGLSCIDCPNPIATPLQTTQYTVTISTPDGCEVSKLLPVLVKINCGEVLIPSAFSPNGDGQNDLFEIRGRCVFSRIMQVYNRWGEKIFESDSLGSSWDGTHKGKALNPGAYVYVVDITFQDGTNEVVKGSVSLVK